jgi:hypothetical protein
MVVFRDQDFKNIGIQRQKEFAQYFGRLHVHVGTIWSTCVSGSYGGSELTDYLSRQELMSKIISNTTTSTWEATIFTVRKLTQPS